MKFLIVRLSSLGDIVHTLPIVYVLRSSFPNAQIDWVVSRGGYELLKLIKELDNVYLPTLKDIELIQKQKYDYVIDVQGLFKSGLLSKLACGKSTIGFKNTREFAHIFYDKKVDAGNLFKTNKHVIDLNLKLISEIAKNPEGKIKFLIPKPNEVVDKYNLVKTVHGMSQPRKVIIFPATTWESKMWPLDYWFNLTKDISKDFQVFVCAAKSDLQCIEKLIKQLDKNLITYTNLIGKTSIKDLIFLVQNVDLVIGLDSFGLHLASAVKNDFGNPEIIGIYGPTSPVRNGPYNLTDNCLYLAQMDCINCRKKKCPLLHQNCMKNILPSQVLELINNGLILPNMLNSKL